MEIKKVYEVVQNALAQSMGTTYMEKTGEISGIASNKLVDIGVDVDESGNLDTFFKGLISQIAYIEVENRAYKGDMNSFMVRDTEWGGFVERVCYDLAEIVDDPKWNLAANAAAGNVDYSNLEHKYYKLGVNSKAFIEAKPIMTPISRPADQIKEAFDSWEQMNIFLSGISTAVQNTIEAGITSMRHMLAQCAIAYTTGTKAGKGCCIHLLSEAKANGIVEEAITAQQAMKNSDFLVYALMRISETRDNMRTMSSVYNNGDITTFTPEEDSRLILLNKFDKATRFHVKANTFNREDLAVGEYETTSAWQGITSGEKAFDFSDCSKIMIAQDATDTQDKLGINLATSAFSKDYCIGLLFDYKAMGISPFKRKVTGSYTASADFFNEFHHVLMNLILDPRYNTVSFFVD